MGFLSRDPGSATGVYNLQAAGNPNAGFNETVFDQPVFDAYASQDPLPDPYVNDKFYDVKIVVQGDFSQDSLATVTSTVNGLMLPPKTIQWGAGGQAYVSAIAFNGSASIRRSEDSSYSRAGNRRARWFKPDRRRGRSSPHVGAKPIFYSNSERGASRPATR